jgi:uncharacterized protein YndB with AHSA1/START domain
MSEKSLIRRNYNIFIKSTPENLWHKMLDSESYKYWTQEFEPTSCYSGKLELGEEIQFLSIDGSGMLVKVAKYEKYIIIGFEIIGFVDNGNKILNQEIPNGVEEYYFEPAENGTELKIIVDTTPDYDEDMNKMWPKALLKLKELAESKEELIYNTPILTQVQINSSPEKVWYYLTTSNHIEKWNHAGNDWACKDSKVDLVEGGKFSSFMYSKIDGEGFIFSGYYTEIVPHSVLKSVLDDGRKVILNMGSFDDGKSTLIRQYFEPESMNSKELQQKGWQLILENFKDYVEKN